MKKKATKKSAAKKRPAKKRAVKKRAAKKRTSKKSIFAIASKNKTYKNAKKRLEKLKKQVSAAYKKAVKSAISGTK
jgi:hypothetical protein